MEEETMVVRPIGLFRSTATEKYEAPRQSGLLKETLGTVQLHPGKGFEEALRDLNGFSHIWLLFWFDRNSSWRPIVRPPRGDQKRGVFATRSPHRPNPIGMSCVELLGIEEGTIRVGGCDLLDRTPIVDIKPYIPYADSFPDAQAGWLDELEEVEYRVEWTVYAQQQAVMICEWGGPNLVEMTYPRLHLSPFPHPSRRIRQLEDGRWELAYKTWRLIYVRDDERVTVEVREVRSGYSQQELTNGSEDRWGDKNLHQRFIHSK